MAPSHIKEIAPKCGIKVEERVFAKGLDVMQAIIAGELDVGTTASEAAISGRAGGAPIFVVAGFAKGGARWSAAPTSNSKPSKTSRARKSASRAAASRKCCCWPSCSKTA
jgi:NitT/TauT family transport system substrate-binding protein